MSVCEGRGVWCEFSNFVKCDHCGNFHSQIFIRIFHSLHGNINVTCMLQVYYIQVACFIMKSVYIFLCNAYITYFNTISPKFVKWKCCLCVSGHLRRVVCGVSFLFELIDVEMSSYIRNNFFCCDKMHIYWAKC